MNTQKVLWTVASWLFFFCPGIFKLEGHTHANSHPSYFQHKPDVKDRKCTANSKPLTQQVSAMVIHDIICYTDSNRALEDRGWGKAGVNVTFNSVFHSFVFIF